VLRAANETKKVMISNLVGLVITVVCGILLIPSYKMEGAIITAMIAYLIPVLMQLFYEFKFLGVGALKIIPIKNVITNSIITLCGLALSYSSKLLFSNNIYIVMSSLIFFSLFVVLIQYKFKSFILQKELDFYIKKIKI
jgi:O-antigen/teichoic acid export membrane protein